MKIQLLALAFVLASATGASTESQLRAAAESCKCSGRVVDKYIGFEMDALGNPYEAGDTPSDLPYGIKAVGQRRKKGKVGPPTENDLVIFNTEMITGMDEDLAVDGEMKVIILQENNDKSEPDDAL